MRTRTLPLVLPLFLAACQDMKHSDTVQADVLAVKEHKIVLQSKDSVLFVTGESGHADFRKQLKKGDKVTIITTADGEVGDIILDGGKHLTL